MFACLSAFVAGCVLFSSGASGNSHQTHVLKPGVHLLGISLINPSVFDGQVDVVGEHEITAAGAVVDFSILMDNPSIPHYLEVSGPTGLAGHRFEVDVPGTVTAGSNRILIAQPRTADLSVLNGIAANFSIRPHITFGQLTSQWDPASLRNGDAITTFVNGFFTTYTYHVGSNQWRTGIGFPQYDRIQPGQGFFFRREAEETTEVVFTGEVRSHAFVQPLEAGIQIIAQGFPVASSFEYAKVIDGQVVPQRNLLNAIEGEPSTVNLSSGDRVHRFVDGKFTTHTYHAPTRRWRKGFTDDTHAAVFLPTEAVWIDLVEPQSDYTVLNPMPD